MLGTNSRNTREIYLEDSIQKSRLWKFCNISTPVVQKVIFTRAHAPEQEINYDEFCLLRDRYYEENHFLLKLAGLADIIGYHN